MLVFRAYSRSQSLNVNHSDCSNMPDANTNPAGLNRTTTILLAEDNEDDILLIESAFKEAGISYHFEVVKDGQRATDYLKGDGPYADRARYPMPFLLLLDLKMPIMNGFE